jgi:hypothetical protein
MDVVAHLGQDGTVSDRVVLDSLDSLGGVLHGHDGDPGLDVLLRCEVEHAEHLGAVTEVGGSDGDGVVRESLGTDVGETSLGHTDEHELLLDVEGGQELVERELGGRGGDDDQVEVALEILLEAGSGGDETLGTHREGVGLLGVRTGEDGHLGTEGGSEQHGVMAATRDISATNANPAYHGQSSVDGRNHSQATETDNADLLAGTDAVTDKRREDGDTTAQPTQVLASHHYVHATRPSPHSHRSHLDRLELLRDGEDEELLGTNVGGVTALVLGTVVPERVVAVDGLDTVVLCECQSNSHPRQSTSTSQHLKLQAREPRAKGRPMGTAEGTTHPSQTCRPCTRGTTRPGHPQRHAGQP